MNPKIQHLVFALMNLSLGLSLGNMAADDAGVSEVTSTGGADAPTLANGADGQVLTILHVSDGGSGVLTPTTPIGYSTITFTNVGDSVTLQYKASIGWFIIGDRGVTIA